MAVAIKPVASFIVGGGAVTGVVSSSFGGFSAADENALSEEEKAELKQKRIEAIAEFLKEGGTSKELKDFVKEYALTLTGAKELTRILTGSLIVDLIENKNTNDSALNKALKEKLDLVRNDASDTSQHKLFGGEDKYKSYHVLKSIRKIFIDELINQLPSVLSSSDGNKLKKDDASDSLIKSSIGDFYDAVLDDYIKYNKPLFVKRVVWKYSSEDVSAKAKALYDEAKEHVPGNFVPPSKAGYLFPVVSDDTKKKWKDFAEKLKSEKGHDEISKYSDDPDNTHIIVPISVVEDPTKTSQFIIAALELHGHAAYFSQWTGKNKGTEKLNLTTEAGEDFKGCSFDSIDSPIPEIKFSNVSSNFDTFDKLFCLEKSKTALKNQKNTVSDFVYLKQDKDDSKAQNWIVFKDRDSIQALGIGHDLQDSSKNVNEIKKELISAAKNTSDNKKYKFDLKKELRFWLEKHFERLFLSQWQAILQAIDSTKTDGGDWKDVVSKLKEVLESVFLKDALVALRNNVLKDYVQLLAKYPPVTVKGVVKQMNPNLAFAGRFPYQYSGRALKTEKKLDNKALVFDYLESIYLSKYEKITQDQVQFESTYESTYGTKNTAYKTELESVFTKKSNDLNPDKKKEEDIVYLFKGGSATQDKAKNIQVTTLLNNLLVSLIHDDGAVDYLTQHAILDYLKDNQKANIFEWDGKWNFKAFSDFKKLDKDDIPKTSFKADSAKTGVVDQEFYAALERDYFLSKINPRLQTVSDPHVYGSLLYEKPKSLWDYKTVKDLEKDLRQFYSSAGYDLLSRENKDIFVELLTMQYLVKNNFENYRHAMTQKLDRNKFSAFVFYKKYDKDGACQPDSTKVDEALDFVEDNTNIWEFNNRWLGFEHTKTEKWKNTNCLNIDDFREFAVMEADDPFTKVKVMGGYKGLLMEDELEKALGKEITEYITFNAPLWTDVESLVNNIRDIKTVQELDKLIELLKKCHPDATWDWLSDKELVETTGSWSRRSSSITTTRRIFTLEERKNILIGFVSQSNKNLVDRNASSVHKIGHQKKFMKGETGNSSSSFLKNVLKKRKRGFVTDKAGSKILKDAQDNSYVVFVEQIRHSDVITLNKDGSKNYDSLKNWSNFIKGLSVDLIAKDVVRLAYDKSIQQKALNYLLNEVEAGKGLSKFVTGDTRLWNKLDISWRGKI
ncbi:hypothetical protein MHSWG343_10380 [Candidatus Mycoplasma haematohominis]|uniref:Uncharacterized protein n=1 Tax=Candidatus Mycoplasma haematohominis TaxID=1494318 RepID=A0A478FVI2_9MOLU|nr:hypothetical protein MHSWG343_10380 [Candidatus Mycoplasma haemohominis]